MLGFTALGQTFESHDLIIIGFLVILEGVLSIDNALVLGLLAKRLPKRLQNRALTYGLVGAFVFRIIAIGLAAYLLQWGFVKLLGGGYLVYVSVRHLFFESQEEVCDQITVDESGQPEIRDADTGKALTPEQEEVEIGERVLFDVPGVRTHFWSTVVVIELTDMAFAVDSILAAIGVVGGQPKGEAIHPKLWVVVTGGMLGVIMMRIAAAIFIRLLQRFPRFEMSAYLLVAVIGGKLLVDWWFNSIKDQHRMDFHDFHRPEFWIFWVLMVLCFLSGFLPTRRRKPSSVDNPPTQI